MFFPALFPIFTGESKRKMSHVLSILLTLALIGIIIYIIAENDHPIRPLFP